MENRRGRDDMVEGNEAGFDEIAKLVDTYRIHWRVVDVPDDRADEMAQELEDHLREAVENGRSVEDVIGGDEVAFSYEWAKEARERRSLAGWVLEIGWTFTGGVAFTAIVYHLFRWSLTFQLETSMFAPVLLFLYFGSVFQLSGEAERQHNSPEWMKWVRAFAVVIPLVFVPTIITWAFTGERNAEFFEWSWLYTLVALVIAIAFSRLAKNSVGQK